MGSNIRVILLLTNAAHKWPGTQKNYTKLNKDGENPFLFTPNCLALSYVCQRKHPVPQKTEGETQGPVKDHMLQSTSLLFTTYCPAWAPGGFGFQQQLTAFEDGEELDTMYTSMFIPGIKLEYFCGRLERPNYFWLLCVYDGNMAASQENISPVVKGHARGKP